MSCQTFVSTCKALCVQTHATLLTNNSQHYWMLHVLSVCTFCCMLLRKVWNWSNFWANNSQHFFCSVIAEAYYNNVGSICTALATLLVPCLHITHDLQSLMGCIIPTMHCRFQHCWELFIASVFTPLLTLLARELLCQFAHSLTLTQRNIIH